MEDQVDRPTGLGTWVLISGRWYYEMGFYTFNRFTRGMSVGSQILGRNEALTDDQLRAAVPSIFATEAHESRSARFTPIPTIKVLDGLRAEGFAVPEGP
jgi:hypothetical protein